MRTAIGAVVAAAIIIGVGCSGISTRAVVTIEEHVTAPVGYWVCTPVFDPEDFRMSNRRLAPRWRHCNGTRPSRYVTPDAIEYLSGGKGYDLDTYDEHGSRTIPDSAFRITGSNTIYNRDAELRWKLEGAILTVQRTNERSWTLRNLSANVTQADSDVGLSMIMFRIGSLEYKRMVAFLECVTANRGRKLFEVVDCGNPLPS